MRIIHLSDLHLSKDNLSALKQFYLRALLKDLDQFQKEKPIDLLVLTGDLVDKGGSSFKDGEDFYEIVKNEFITPILSQLQLDKSRFIFIPGNHDIIESEIDDISENGILKFLDINRVNKYLDDNKNNYHDGIKRIKVYKEFEKGFYKDTSNHYLTNFESCFVIDINGDKIGIGAFNSAWRCSTNLKEDQLLFGTQQILNTIEFFKSNGTSLNIALIHHPLELISEVDRQELTTFLHTNEFHILLCGHTHRSDNINTLGTGNKLFTSVAKTAFSNPREKDNRFKSGYSILDFEKKITGDIEIACFFRKYVHKRTEFDKDVDTSPNGELKDLLRISANGDDFNKYLILTDRTCRAKQELMNTALVIHGTDSIAPCSINEIFVLPKLTDRPTLSADIDGDLTLIKLPEVLNSDKNILIIGDKETGKSTLLNKIFIESSNSFTNYQKIPIEINFSELKRKDIKPIIKGFLNEPSHEEIEKMLKKGKLLLLIDDYNDDDEHTHAVNRLKRFIDLYPQNKILVTTATDIDTLLTSENTIFTKKNGEDNIKEFKLIFIGSVGVKEFKELAIKWFSRKDSEWIQNNLEKLIKVFEILRIPRTFFSISLFLYFYGLLKNKKILSQLIRQTLFNNS